MINTFCSFQLHTSSSPMSRHHQWFQPQIQVLHVLVGSLVTDSHPKKHCHHFIHKVRRQLGYVHVITLAKNLLHHLVRRWNLSFRNCAQSSNKIQDGRPIGRKEKGCFCIHNHFCIRLGKVLLVCC